MDQTDYVASRISIVDIAVDSRPYEKEQYTQG